MNQKDPKLLTKSTINEQYLKNYNYKNVANN